MQDLRYGIFNKFSGEADCTSPWTTIWVLRSAKLLSFGVSGENIWFDSKIREKALPIIFSFPLSFYISDHQNQFWYKSSYMFLCLQANASVKAILKLKCFHLGPQSLGSKYFSSCFPKFEIPIPEAIVETPRIIWLSESCATSHPILGQAGVRFFGK